MPCSTNRGRFRAFCAAASFELGRQPLRPSHPKSSIKTSSSARSACASSYLIYSNSEKTEQRFSIACSTLFGQCQLHPKGVLHGQHVCLGQLVDSGFESHLVSGHDLVGHGFAFAACNRYPRFARINSNWGQIPIKFQIPVFLFRPSSSWRAA